MSESRATDFQGRRIWQAILTALALVAAWLVGSGIGSGLDLLVLAAGFAALACVSAVLSLPMLGLAIITVVIATNASNNLTEHLDLPSLAKLMLPGAMLLLAYRWLAYDEAPLLPRLASVLLGGYGFLMVLSLPFALNWEGTSGTLEDYVKDATAALLVVAFFSNPRAMAAFIWALFAAGFALSSLTVAAFAFDVTGGVFGFARVDEAGRFTGPIEDPNYFGSYLLVFLCASLYFTFFRKEIFLRALGTLAASLILFALTLTQSRGAMLAGCVVVGSAALVLDRRKAVWLVAIVAAFAAFAAALLSDQVARLAEVALVADLDSVQEKSIVGRLSQWIVAINLFLDYPIFGVGAGNYNVKFQDYSLDLGLMFRNGSARAAHSLYLEILAERGIVGFAWFVAIICFAMSGVAQAAARAAEAGLEQVRGRYVCLGLALIGYFAAAVFLHETYPRIMWVLLGVAISLPAIANFEIAACSRRRSGAAAGSAASAS